MKKTTLLFTLFFGTIISFGQYNFTKSTGTYSDLSGATVLTGGLTWDDPQLTVPVGFNFQYFDSTINKVYIEDYGLGGFISIDNSESGVIPTLIAYGSDIIDRGYDFTSGSGSTGGLSPISYQLSGFAGSRILKIEWKNVGFYSDIDDNNISTDYVNFQLWLYEGSNNFEIRFGPNSVTQPSLSYDGATGTFIGLMPQYNYSTDLLGAYGYFLENLASNPTYTTINSIDSVKFLNGTIPNGTIYKFTKTGGSVSIIENKPTFKSKIFPNPANNYINVAADNESQKISQIEIMDMNGKLVKTVTSGFNTIDVSQFNSGIYLVRVTSVDGLIANSKFVKN